MTQPSRVQSAPVHKNPGRFGGSFHPEMLRPCFRGGSFRFYVSPVGRFARFYLSMGGRDGKTNGKDGWKDKVLQGYTDGVNE